LRISDISKDSNSLFEVYNLLYKFYGPRHWWPAEDDFEVAIGAILTQNTNWSNVEKAICNLKRESLLSPDRLRSTTLKKLAKTIRPSGYFNLKARRIKSFIEYLYSRLGGSLKPMRRRRLDSLREELLLVSGIGPETADSILLYAIKKPVFVIDAYTRRITSCLNLINPNSTYHDMQSFFMKNLPQKTALYNEYHALIVEHGKCYCRPKPRCSECILRCLKGEL